MQQKQNPSRRRRLCKLCVDRELSWIVRVVRQLRLHCFWRNICVPKTWVQITIRSADTEQAVVLAHLLLSPFTDCCSHRRIRSFSSSYFSSHLIIFLLRSHNGSGGWRGSEIGWMCCLHGYNSMGLVARAYATSRTLIRCNVQCLLQ